MVPFHVEDSPLLLDHYINVFIGTPPQPFRLSLSLSKISSFVLDSSCIGDCPLRLFNRSASSTFNPVAEDYIDDTLSLLFGFDTMTVSPNITATNVEFIVAKPDYFQRDFADGVFNLGPSSEFDKFSFLWKLAKQGNVQRAIFAVYLNSTVGGKSLLSFGETKESTLADGPFVPVKCLKTEDPEWRVNVTVGGKRDVYQAVLMTNYLGISLPAAPYEAVKNQTCRSTHCSPAANGFLQFPCTPKTHFSDLEITVGGNEFPLAAEFYVQRKGNVCWLLVTRSDSEDVVLGQPFFYAYYLSFDMETNFVGIARSVNGKRAVKSSHWLLYSIIGIPLVIAVIIAVVLLLRKRNTSTSTGEPDLLREQLDVRL